MTFKEALDTCNKDGWQRFVITSEEHLGKNAFLTESWYIKDRASDSPVTGAIDKSKGKRLIMTTYLGNNEFTSTGVPFKINPDSEDWEAEVFICDTSIGEFEVGGVKVKEENGSIQIIEQEKLRKLMESAAANKYSIEKAVTQSDLDKAEGKSIDILDPKNYFG